MKLSAAVQSLSRRMGYEIRRTGDHFYKRPIDFIRSRGIDLVIDVGANIGQYGESLRNKGYTGWIVSFEPVRSTYEALSVRTRRDERWNAVNVALGEAEGRAAINVSEDSVFSSLLPQLDSAIKFDPKACIVRQEEIRVTSLDELFGELPKHNVPFLKIDTQGYERQVLAGAGAHLSSFAGVQLELPIMHLYEGTWQFKDAVSYMDARGFEISNIVPVNYDHTDTVSLSEVDCIFKRKVNS